MYGDANFINQVPLFSGLDEAQQVSLQQKMGQTTLRRGETLFDEGDLGDRLYIVTEGKVKLGHTSNDGRESLLAVLGPGEILGELTLFDPGPRSTTATAVSPATLLHLQHTDLMEIVEANPTLAKHMLRALAQRRRVLLAGWVALAAPYLFPTTSPPHAQPPRLPPRAWEPLRALACAQPHSQQPCHPGVTLVHPHAQ